MICASSMWQDNDVHVSCGSDGFCKGKPDGMTLIGPLPPRQEKDSGALNNYD